ncbi:MAG: hypothetical protein K6C35_06570 [Eubacterium sp.]|nr:hypothetical protein [Eubacterium sp.]
MFCVKCGNKIKEGEYICDRCGFNNKKFMPQFNDSSKSNNDNDRTGYQQYQNRPVNFNGYNVNSNGFANGNMDANIALDEEETINLKSSYIPESFVTENGFRNVNAMPYPPSQPVAADNDDIQTVSLEMANMAHNQNGFGNVPLNGSGPLAGSGPVTGSGPLAGNGPVAGSGPLNGSGPLAGSGTVFGSGPLAGNGPVSGSGPLNGSNQSMRSVSGNFGYDASDPANAAAAEEIKKKIEEAKAKNNMKDMTLEELTGANPNNSKKNIMIGVIATAVIAAIVVIIFIVGGGSKKDKDEKTTQVASNTTTESTTKTTTEKATEATTEKPAAALTHVEAVETTLTKAGNIEYWYSEADKKYYADEKGTKEIKEDDIEIYPFGSKDAKGLIRYEKNKILYQVQGGLKDEGFTGFSQLDDDWYFVVKGVVSEKRNGFFNGKVNNVEGKWLVRKGKVLFTDTVAKDDDGVLWYVKDGKIEKVDAIGKNKDGYWYCKAGRVATKFSGTVTVDGKEYEVEKGKVVSGIDENTEEKTE